MKEKMQRRLFIILFLVPTLIAFVLFYVYPLITVFVTTLCKWDYQNLNAPELLPLDDLLANYRYIFTEYPYFKTALVNSLKWALCGALIATPIALITALVTSWKLPGWKWMKNIYIIPNIISAAAIGLIFLQLYNPRYGLLTLIVQWFRPEFKESILLIQPQNFWAMTLAYILFQGTASIMLLGQISSVPQEVYEAAKIDGATGFKLDWYITIPCIKGLYGLGLRFFGSLLYRGASDVQDGLPRRHRDGVRQQLRKLHQRLQQGHGGDPDRRRVGEGEHQRRAERGVCAVPGV